MIKRTIFLLTLKGDLMSDKQKNPLPKILGDNFRDAREKLGLSIEELANKAILSNSQIRQIEGQEQGAFYSPFIKYSSAQKVAKILGLSEDQAFNAGESMLDENNEALRKQKEFNEIEAMLAQKMINEIQFERPSLVQKVIGKKASSQLPIQGIEVSQTTWPKPIFKRIVFLVILMAVLGVGYWFFNPPI